jgi:plasmid maintenance system antidote protein VapI
MKSVNTYRLSLKELIGMLHRENKIRNYHTSSAADLIKETMTYYHITQTDLAERIGVSQKNVSEILQRKRFINEVIALRIERVMVLSSILLLNLDVVKGSLKM